MTQHTFIPAVAGDYHRILELNDAAVPAVNRIDVAELEHLHAQSLALITARSASGELDAFLLVLPESADYGSENFQYFKARYASFAYVDRIVVGTHLRGAGIGAGLYAALFARTDRPLVTCEVNVEPPNPGSIRFHERLGFTAVGEQDTGGGEKRVLLMARGLEAGRGSDG